VGPAGGATLRLTNDSVAIREAFLQYSPSGDRIAFQGQAEGSENNSIYVMNADGTGRETLVDAAADNTDNIRPQWSPDGKYIAFSSNRTGKLEIYIINLETKDIYQVTSGRNTAIATAWGQ
jgi:Tol biopolymer transport system component